MYEHDQTVLVNPFYAHLYHEIYRKSGDTKVQVSANYIKLFLLDNQSYTFLYLTIFLTEDKRQNI